MVDLELLAVGLKKIIGGGIFNFGEMVMVFCMNMVLTVLLVF